MSVNKNSEQIASLGTRVSSLVDELHSVKKEIELFKKAVAADMKVVLNHVGKNKQLSLEFRQHA